MSDVNMSEVNNKSLDLLAEIAEPYFELLKDPDFTKLYVSNMLEAIKYACIKHKDEVIKIGAALEGKPVEEYVVNPFTLPLKLVTAIGMYSKINSDLFISADQNKDSANSGSAMESTEAQEQQTNS